MKQDKGRPRIRLKGVAGDAAYDNEGGRTYLRRRGIKANIPINFRHKPKRGRPYKLNVKTYKYMRSSIERFSSWLIGFRRLTLRWKRLVSTFLRLIQLACIIIYWRVLG